MVYLITRLNDEAEPEFLRFRTPCGSTWVSSRRHAMKFRAKAVAQVMLRMLPRGYRASVVASK